MVTFSKQQVIGGLLFTFLTTFQLGFRYTVKNREPIHPATEIERKGVFDEKSTKFDRQYNFDEWALGIKKWRQQLLSYAEGDVLEVAVGTGRNFSFYDPLKVRSLTVTDFSKKMLEVASQKKKEIKDIPIRFVVENAVHSKCGANSFDTIVDTFGLCSYEKPVETLKELRRLLKDDGRLLLLEHGEASFSPISRYMHENVNHHSHKHGCFYNRDIHQLITEADFIIEEDKRKIFGTLYMMVARKGNKNVADEYTNIDQ